MRMSPIRGRCILLHGVLILAGAVTPGAVAGPILFVDDDASVGGDGSSWSAAYRFLQDALTAAGGGAEIRVAQGTYLPDRSAASPGGTGDRAATFQMLSGVSILGGFAGLGAPDPDARDIVGFTTILSGDLNGDDGPPGTFADNAENSRSVLTGDDTDPTAILDGCTVTGGNASGPQSQPFDKSHGGGIWNGNGSPTVRDCRIEYNTALYRGAGMYSWTDTSPVVIRCTFTGNVCTSTGSGGGLRTFNSNATVTDCVFIDNSAETGGGMADGGDSAPGGSNAVITGCTFTGNTAIFGGGLGMQYGASTTVTDCTVLGNVAGAGGGMFVETGSTAVVAGSTFCDNLPTQIGGNWTDAGGNSLCPPCDKSSGLVLEVPADYPTIQLAINAACDGSEVVVSPGTYFERILLGGKNITVRSTHGPGETIIDGQGTGTVVLIMNTEADLNSVLDGFTITNGLAELGGGARVAGGNVSIIDCHFTDNVADIAGAIRHDLLGGSGQLNLLRCVFNANQAFVGAGAVFSVGSLSAVDCVFTNNDGGQGPGAVGSTGSFADYVNCVFAGNSAGFLAGGVADGSGNLSIVNCVFSHNAALMGGGMAGSAASAGAVTNCTFSLNQGGGVEYSPPLVNCILWGNGAQQIADPLVVASNSLVQGGWPGSGNIDADPLFVQPGTDDVRLAFGSPCTDTGSNAELPADAYDLDGDGDTTEPIPFDAGGAPRVQGPSVDMGAWEGEFEPGPPGGSASNLDQGGSVVLVPGAAPFNPLETPAVLLTNTAGDDNATAVVVQIDLDVYPGAGGFTELGSVFTLSTSLANGEFFATIFIPFDAETLAGAEPQQMNLTGFDGAVGNWAFASSANIQTSPGFTGPIGNRVVALQGGGWGLTDQIGDYGVYWNPQLQQGFVWANVDTDGDFGVGFALCPSDCLQTPDGSIGVQDMLALLGRWGAAAGGGPCDADDDGVIDVLDFTTLLLTWGPCQAASAAPSPGPDRPTTATARRTAKSPDLDANGLVDAADLAILRSAWGPCSDCAADLDDNGRVEARDLLWLLQQVHRFRFES